MKTSWFAAAILLVFTHSAEARDNSIVLEDDIPGYDLSNRVMVLEDKSRSLTPAEVLSGAADERFIVPRSRELNYSFSRSAYWIRFNVENRARRVEMWLLQIPYPIIDSAVLYCRDEAGGIVEMKNGDTMPLRARPVTSNNLVYLLPLKSGRTQTFYLRVTSNNSIVIPMEILSAREYARKSSTEQLIMGFYYGLVFIMFFYYLMLFLSIKDISYLLYAAMTLSLIFYVMSIHGHSFVYFWPDSPGWGDLAPVVFLGIAGLFLLLFVRRYFDLTRHSVVFNRIIIAVTCLFLPLIAALFIIDRLVASVMVSVGIIAALGVSFASGIILIRKKVPHAKAFTFTWMIFLAGGLLYTMRGFGIFHYHRGLLGFLEVNYAITQLFFAMSIVYRIDSEKKEKLAAQAALLEKMKLIDESEEQFGRRLQSDRMKSISVFAGGIAHDFNNLLTAILGNISIAKCLVGVPEQAQRVLADAEKASLLVKNLTAQLLSFTRGGEPVRKVVAIAGMLADIAKLSLSGTNVRGELDIEDGLWCAMVNEGQVHQAIQNLILNSRESMPGGGTVTVRARNITIDAPNEFDLSPGSYVSISVRDCGIGIPADKLGEIFFPYYTTKKTGSGLGLAVCYSVVSRHGGHIGVRSAPGEGSEFTVYLPACKGVVEEKAAPAGEITLGGRRILIMDDEEMVLDIGERMLVKLGLVVTRARNGEEAICYYRDALANGRAYDAVILDLTVRGGLGGRETAARLLEIDPGARVIASSGYATDPIMAHYAEYGFKDVLPKPYRFDEMRETMSRMFPG